MTVAVVAVVVGSGAFYGGMKYAQAKRGYLPAGRQDFANLTPEQRQQLMANGSAGFRGMTGQGRGGANGDGFTSGDVISKDDKSITIKMRDGGSKIIFYSNNTEVSKFVNGMASDLEVGKYVTINGTVNQDGSVTAQLIQIRPNLPSPSQSN